MSYKTVLSLNSRREIIGGSKKALIDAINRGADLRIYTEFNFEEHIEPGSPNKELVKEVSDFRVSYLIDKRHVAAIMNLRMPVHPPKGFGERPSWSFFMYNQDGQQAIARPFLDHQTMEPPCGECPPVAPRNMPKYHALSNYDDNSNAPCHNFIYDFEKFGFIVQDNWTEVFAHDEFGKTISGSFDDFMDAFSAGADMKVGIKNFLSEDKDQLDYEIFTHCGPGYYNTKSRIYCMSTQPTVVVEPAIPMVYKTNNWSSGNILVRTDGEVEYWFYNPYTMEYAKKRTRAGMRYFVR